MKGDDRVLAGPHHARARAAGRRSSGTGQCRPVRAGFGRAGGRLRRPDRRVFGGPEPGNRPGAGRGDGREHPNAHFLAAIMHRPARNGKSCAWPCATAGRSARKSPTAGSSGEFTRQLDKGARRTVKDRPEAGLLGRGERSSPAEAQGTRDDGARNKAQGARGVWCPRTLPLVLPLAPSALRHAPCALRLHIIYIYNQFIETIPSIRSGGNPTMPYQFRERILTSSA